MKNDFSFYDVEKINVTSKETADSSWVTLKVTQLNGQGSELTFWAVKEENIRVVIGDD